ncbi:MAG: serine hydrolase [Propionivibrio sp.]
MKHAMALLLLLPALTVSVPVSAAESCAIETVGKSGLPAGAWLNQDNWLSPEYLRAGLQAPGNFMASKKIGSASAPLPLKRAPQALDLARTTTTDPLDQAKRSLAFLLGTRLAADGFLAMRNGRVVSEQYWNGLSAPQARPLLGGTRPVLSLLGEMAVAQGKLAADRSVVRYVPALSAQTGLRKLSLQRLLEGDSRLAWSAADLDGWRGASGWTAGTGTGGVRDWLAQPERWNIGFSDARPKLGEATPEDDLLAWTLAEAYQAPLAQVLCDSLLTRLRPENPVLWLTDGEGTELSAGLALSLRDLARFGQLLIDARVAGNRSKIPAWFIETLTASSGARKAKPSEVDGLTRGSELRYGFVHLGGAANRIALLGPYGNSLYIDFDRRLVVALYASYPKEYSPSLLATLEQLWEAVGAATQPAGKRQ